MKRVIKMGTPETVKLENGEAGIGFLVSYSDGTEEFKKFSKLDAENFRAQTIHSKEWQTDRF